jgi:HK97 family phage portal protein
MWMVTVYDYCWFGESYWHIVQARNGQPVELWWMPPWSVIPESPADGTTFISHYTYTPLVGSPQKLSPKEVIHFRHGLNPHDPRHGLPPLRSVIREIWTDDEASNFVGSLLRNSAVASVLITPDPQAGEGAILGVEQVETIKSYISDQFTGDQRGKPLAIQGPMKVQKLSFSPQELDLSSVRNVAEERTCAALGIPAAVVGFGTGLEQTRVGATMSEENGMAWQNGLIPMQRIMGATLAQTLLPWYEPQRTDRFRLEWDYSRVAALAEDQNAKAVRLTSAVQGGWMMVSEAREAMGLESQPTDEVYLRSFATVEVPAGQPMAPPPAPAMVGNGNGHGNGNGNGNGNGDDDTERRWLKQPMDEVIAALVRLREPPKLRRAPRQLALLVRRLEREAVAHERAFMADLAPIFEQLGQQVAASASRVLDQKQLEDILDATRIMQGMRILDIEMLLGRAYERHYRSVAQSVWTAMGEALELDVDIPDVVMRSILVTGGRRLGLLDLQRTTRESIYTELGRGRAAGEGVDQLVRRLRGSVPGGPWGSSDIRSRVIARTETKYAQNVSSVARGHDAGMTHYMLFDARLGPTDEDCEQRDGQIVTEQEAAAAVALEHPQGTLSVSPVPSLLLEELGVEV